MRVFFRADASMQIGTGHVMRGLTLASGLRAHGAECQFICRAHEGNLIDLIRSTGFVTHVLPKAPTPVATAAAASPHANGRKLSHHHWLGATQAEDAQACVEVLAGADADWLVVDHYALDARWERALEGHYAKLMVIDDLADRPHQCDVLLDQTFGRQVEDYHPWVPDTCELLCGSQYALLRPEFAAWRNYSLSRRAAPKLRHLLVSMGGVDKDNATSRVLEALHACSLPPDCRITVVMGSNAPWMAHVENLAATMPWPTTVLANVRDMAQLMAECDLAIGAAGATSWERCCLGLPTIMTVLAENQRYAASLLEQAQAARILHQHENLAFELNRVLKEFAGSMSSLKTISDRASSVTDGKGCQRASATLLRQERE